MVRNSARFLAFAALTLLAATPALSQPTFEKVFAPDTIGVGSHSELIFTIDNGGGGPVSDLAFTDILPAGLILGAPASPATTCGGGVVSAPDGGDTISMINGTVGAGQTCEVRVFVTSVSPGVFMNVTGDLTSSAGSSGPATDDLTVSASRLSFSKAFSPSTVQLGGDSTLTFTIVNTTGTGRDFISFVDALPSGLVVASPSNLTSTCGGVLTAVPGSTSISQLLGAVAANSSCTLSLDVTTQIAGLLVNRSSDLSSSVGSGGFAVDALQVNVDPLGLVKSFLVNPVPPGAQTTLRFSVSNRTRGSSATNIAFTDDLNATLSGLVAVAPLPTNPCGAGSTLTGTSLLALSGGNLASGATCTFDVTVQVPAGATPATYANTTSTVTADVGGSMLVGSPAVDDLVVAPVPLLSKTFLDANTLMPVSTVAAGDDVVVEFTITNSSAVAPATNIAFTDELSTFLGGTVASVLPAPGFCNGSGSIAQAVPNGVTTLFVSGVSLAAGASCSFQVTLTLPPNVAGNVYTNTTSEITGAVNAEAVIGPPASADLEVVSAPQLTKNFLPAAAQAGDLVDLEFTLVYSANATQPATGVAFTDDLDAALTGLTAVSLPANGFCGAGAQMTGTSNLSVTGASLDPGDSCTFQVTVQVPAGAMPGTYPNTTSSVTATVDGLAVDQGPASADLTVLGLVLSKSFIDSPAVAGGTATLMFTLNNVASPLAATGIGFTDDLSAVISGMTATGLPPTNFCGTGSTAVVVGGGSLLIVSGASVPAGGSCSFQVTVQVPGGTPSGSYTNVTSNVTALVDGTPATLPPAVAGLLVIDPLSISKSFTDDPTTPGGTVTLEFTLTNVSPTDSATGLAFTDNLGAALTGLTATSLPMAGFCGAGSTIAGTSVLTVSGANLPPSSSCTFPVTLQVPMAVPSGSMVVNTTSTLTGFVGGVAASAPPASDTLRIDLVELTKSFASPVGAGGTVTLSFQITNEGAGAVTNVGFTDDLDAALTGLVAVGLPASAVCGAGSTLSGTSFLAFSGGSLGAGESCNFDVTVQVPAAAAPGIYTNTTSGLFIQGLASGTPASADLEIEPPPGFDKVFSPSVVGEDAVSTLTFTVDNSASVIAATGLAFTDNLPMGVVVANPSGATSTCGGSVSAAPGSGTVSLSGGSVAAGAMCTVQVGVTAAMNGSYVNTSGALTSSLGNSGTTTANLQVEPPPGFTKAFAPALLAVDDVSTLTFTVDNSAAILDATDLAFTDNLPAGLVVATPSGALSGCGGTVTAVEGSGTVSFSGGSVAAGNMCTVQVNVTAAAGGSYVNLSGDLTSSLGNSGTATDTVEFLEAELTLSKEFLGDAAPNGTVDLQLTVTNLATDPVTGITFSDDLDAVLPGLVAVGLPQMDLCGVGSQVSGTSVVTLTGGSLPASGECTFVVTLQVPAAVPPAPATNVTSPVTFDRRGVALEAAAAMAVLSPDPLVIPTLSFWGLLALALVLAAAGWRRLG